LDGTTDMFPSLIETLAIEVFFSNFSGDFTGFDAVTNAFVEIAGCTFAGSIDILNGATTGQAAILGNNGPTQFSGFNGSPVMVDIAIMGNIMGDFNAFQNGVTTPTLEIVNNQFSIISGFNNNLDIGALLIEDNTVIDITGFNGDNTKKRIGGSEIFAAVIFNNTVVDISGFNYITTSEFVIELCLDLQTLSGFEDIIVQNGIFSLENNGDLNGVCFLQSESSFSNYTLIIVKTNIHQTPDVCEKGAAGISAGKPGKVYVEQQHTEVVVRKESNVQVLSMIFGACIALLAVGVVQVVKKFRKPSEERNPLAMRVPIYVNA